jgi:mRNA interferase MazF
MKKGEIWMANLNPNMGKEQSGIRPIVIISGNAMNDHYDLIIYCPLTTKIKGFIGDIIITPTKSNGIKKESEILVFQVRSISKQRIQKKVGSIKAEELELLHENLNKILKY